MEKNDIVARVTNTRALAHTHVFCSQRKTRRM